MPPDPCFTQDSELHAIARGVENRTLPKSAWTHAAHFAAALVLLEERGAARASRELPALIRAYNEATGVANTATSGYHETITQASLAAAATFRAARPSLTLFETANALLASKLGKSDWLFEYWSRELLLSPAARRAWIDPDLQPLNPQSWR